MIPALKTRASAPSASLAGSDIADILKRLYANRGVRDVADIDLALKHLHPPQKLRGIGDAAALVADAIEGEARVMVIGDFDADGATSVALAVSVLRQLGLKDVSYLVPNRFEFGYGLSPEIVALAANNLLNPPRTRTVRIVAAHVLAGGAVPHGQDVRRRVETRRVWGLNRA